MPGPTGPVTLGDLNREDKLLWVYCRDCYHERDINPATVPLPPGTPVPEVGTHMKCSARGSRKVDSRPSSSRAASRLCGDLEASHKLMRVVVWEEAEAGSTCALRGTSQAQRPGYL